MSEDKTVVLEEQLETLVNDLIFDHKRAATIQKLLEFGNPTLLPFLEKKIASNELRDKLTVMPFLEKMDSTIDYGDFNYPPDAFIVDVYKVAKSDKHRLRLLNSLLGFLTDEKLSRFYADEPEYHFKYLLEDLLEAEIDNENSRIAKRVAEVICDWLVELHCDDNYYNIFNFLKSESRVDIIALMEKVGKLTTLSKYEFYQTFQKFIQKEKTI